MNKIFCIVTIFFVGFVLSEYTVAQQVVYQWQHPQYQIVQQPVQQYHNNQRYMNRGVNHQAIAEQKVRQMARMRYSGHLGRPSSNFEGTGSITAGWGPAPTCTPPQPWRYQLVADASLQSGGTVYRVRSWKKVR